ncbi:MAG: RluA family pseudouridine synthase [Porticoccaceae bacterium]|nr:RluA family pseudouridine synthase [Porticoccaceae bacterium]
MNPAPDQFELHLSITDSGQSAIGVLATASALSKKNIKQTMQNGAVWLTHSGNTRRLRRAKHSLQSGDELHLYYDLTIQSAVPPVPLLIADEGDYSVWHKPHGMYSQGTKWGDHCTVGRWVERHLDRTTFTVHRLDRAAMGLILLAHKKSSAAKLSALFAERKIHKRYRARVNGQFPVEQQSINEAIEGREARSHVQLINYNAQLNSSLVEIDIETGRKHQIRRHLSNAGYPIIGDRLYGSVKQDCTKRKCAEEGDQKREDLQLLAYHLSFIDPVSSVQKNYCVPQKLHPLLTAPLIKHSL